MVDENVGKRLKRLRKQKAMTQAALAAAANVTQGTIGNIESGVRDYGSSIVNIARALGVTPEYLRCKDPEHLPMKREPEGNAHERPVPTTVEALARFDFDVKRITQDARNELRKVIDLYLTDPVRYGALAEAILELLQATAEKIMPATPQGAANIIARLGQHLGPPLQEDFEDEARLSGKRGEGQ